MKTREEIENDVYEIISAHGQSFATVMSRQVADYIRNMLDDIEEQIAIDAAGEDW